MLVIPRAADGAKRKNNGLHVRVGAFIVSFLSEASAEEIGKMLKSYDLDIVGLTEVPRAPASQDLATAVGADYFVVGTISSGESEDKLKTIVCRTPLSPMSEIDLFAKDGFVTGGESTTHAETVVEGVRISIYCLHISEKPESIEKLIRHDGFRNDDADVVLAIGDFNARLSDPQMKLFQEHGFRPSWLDLKLDVQKCKTYDLLPGRGPNGEDRDEGVIDHITYRGRELKAVDGGIVSAKVGDSRPMSDHAMIWCELVIPMAPAR
jgi:hypothetical protein